MSDEPDRSHPHRLSNIAAQLRSECPIEELTSGVGFRLWETRRANKFKRALALLCARRNEPDIDELRLAANELSDQIAIPLPLTVFAAHVEDSALKLPRGYRLVSNRAGDLSLELDGFLFSPSLTEPLPDRRSIERLSEDLKAGLLREIEAYFAEIGVD